MSNWIFHYLGSNEYLQLNAILKCEVTTNTPECSQPCLNLRLVYPVIEHNQEFLEFLITDWIVYQILDHESEDHVLI